MVTVPDDYTPIKGWEEELWKMGGFDAESEAKYEELMGVTAGLIDASWEDGYKAARDFLRGGINEVFRMETELHED